MPSVPSHRTRLLRRAFFLALFFLLSACIFFLSPFPFSTPPCCTAVQYSTGRWVPKDPPVTGNTSVVDVLEASGFQGCTQEWFKPFWFLGTKEEDWRGMGEYRWRAAQWMWESEEEVCREEIRRPGQLELLRQLVEDGGWLLLGDSLSEQHFFELGCTLYPHVDVQFGVSWWEQYMFLKPTSPLLVNLTLPANFSLTSTPLVTNLRSDHGFPASELVSIYASTPSASDLPPSQLLTDYPVQSPSSAEYLDRFFSRDGNYTLRSDSSSNPGAERYSTLIFSTGAHFTTREFALPRGEDGMLSFFGAIAAEWARTAAEYLEQDTLGRRIFVRSATSGHDRCHEAEGPFEEESPEPEGYNWAQIPGMNDIFE
ncbi:hypothetical protein JCM10213_003857 [Rhodosporidiobolus nylandii]